MLSNRYKSMSLARLRAVIQIQALVTHKLVSLTRAAQVRPPQQSAAWGWGPSLLSALPSCPLAQWLLEQPCPVGWPALEMWPVQIDMCFKRKVHRGFRLI